MRCPHCNGKGRKELSRAYSLVCGWCNGTGQIASRTNFDRVTESPETLAEFICELWTKDKDHLYEKFEAAEYEEGIGIGGKNAITKWLKEEMT